MSAAEVGEVVDRGVAAVGVVVGVVEVGAVRGAAAAGEPAVLVAGAQQPADLGRGPVPVDGVDDAGHGVGDDPVPSRCDTGEGADRVGVDRTDAGEHRTRLGRTGERGDRDGDLHGRVDRGQPVATGGAGEQQVGEHVGRDLREGAVVERTGPGVRGGRCVGVGLGVRVNSGGATGLVPGLTERDAGVLHLACHPHDAVDDPVREHAGEPDPQGRHPVDIVEHVDAPFLAGGLVPFGHGVVVCFLGLHRDERLQPPRRLRQCDGDRVRFELRPRDRIRDPRPCALDHGRMLERDHPVSERGVRGGELPHQRLRPRELPLHRRVTDPQRRTELRREGPHRELRIAPTPTHLRTVLQREIEPRGEHRDPLGFQPGDRGLDPCRLRHQRPQRLLRDRFTGSTRTIPVGGGCSIE